MPRLTTDPNDPRLTHGTDSVPTPQAEVYLVLSDEERAKGFVRPVRRVYRHVGPPGPKYPLADLTPQQQERQAKYGYVKFEAYPESELPVVGKYWTQAELDNIGKGCNTETTMGTALAETWAAQPSFYGATFCVRCSRHLPVNEFVWCADDSRLGT